MPDKVHVVSKRDHSKHATVSIDTDLPPLAPSSIRVRTSLINLSKNNLAYAQLGALLGWWSAFPVPQSLPAPYNNSDEWGIVPAWGYAEVIESTMDVLVGSSIFGFWPTSSYYHDLLLEALVPQSHYREVSEHRQVMMNIYNRYICVGKLPAEDVSAWSTFLVWGTGFLLNRFSFPSDGSAPIHPGGLGDWTKEDADLTSSVVIGLSTSSKTGRSFSWNLTRNRGADNAPIACIQVSSTLSPGDQTALAPFPVKTVGYDDLTSESTLSLISAQNPGRLVIVDFGARDGVVERLLASASAVLPKSTKFTIFAVGGRFGLVGDPALPQLMTKGQQLQRVQCNHSPLQDAAMEAVGPALVYDEWSTALKRFLDDGAAQDVKVVYRTGVEGATGIEGAWDDLCSGRISSQEALVFRIK